MEVTIEFRVVSWRVDRFKVPVESNGGSAESPSLFPTHYSKP